MIDRVIVDNKLKSAIFFRYIREGLVIFYKDVKTFKLLRNPLKYKDIFVRKILL